MALGVVLVESTTAPASIESAPMPSLPVPLAFTSAASEIVPVPVKMLVPALTVRLPLAARFTFPLTLAVLIPVTSIVPALAAMLFTPPAASRIGPSVR